MLSERSQHKRPRTVWFYLDEMSRRANPWRQTADRLLPGPGGSRNGEALLVGTGVLLWVMKISGIRAMAAQPRILNPTKLYIFLKG